ncbi:MAG: hypothetical protein LBK18_04360 [Prevotellaceae bacterium]|jgi:hypothetical protein|nr:hypothetical protein [Prevotellaceae bacterium]
MDAIPQKRNSPFWGALGAPLGIKFSWSIAIFNEKAALKFWELVKLQVLLAVKKIDMK